MIGRLSKLQDVFLQVVLDINQRLPLFNRHTSLRIRNWVQRLSKTSQNITWKRCRNTYASLLRFQLSKGQLEAPFDCEPPSGPLTNLPIHLRVELLAARRNRHRQGGQLTARSAIEPQPRIDFPPGAASTSPAHGEETNSQAVTLGTQTSDLCIPGENAPRTHVGAEAGIESDVPAMRAQSLPRSRQRNGERSEGRVGDAPKGGPATTAAAAYEVSPNRGHAAAAHVPFPDSARGAAMCPSWSHQARPLLQGNASMLHDARRDTSNREPLVGGSRGPLSAVCGAGAAARVDRWRAWREQKMRLEDAERHNGEALGRKLDACRRLLSTSQVRMLLTSEVRWC